MAQIIPNEYGNIAGRIGKGFGQTLAQGLTEQIPKEAERYRLAQGLRQMQENPQATPLDRLIQLYGLPGGKEAAPQLEPYLSNLALSQGQNASPGNRRVNQVTQQGQG